MDTEAYRIEDNVILSPVFIATAQPVINNVIGAEECAGKISLFGANLICIAVVKNYSDG